MARKKPPEEHENHERWLVSYADFITLLFAFFVVMYAISSVNEGKYRVLSDALMAAFRSSPKSLEPIQIGSLSKAPIISMAQVDHRKPAMVRLPKMFISQYESQEGAIRDPLLDEEFTKGNDTVNIEKIADAVEKSLGALVDQGLITVNRNALWIEVDIKDSILFPSGSARFHDDALPILEELARILQEFSNPLRIEGYTDNVPINTIVYPSNWELSAARAASVIRLFAGTGISPQRMVAQGYGEYRPVADNNTSEGRAKNRRVVIVVLADKEVERLLGDRAEAARRQSLAADGVADETTATPSTVPQTTVETAAPAHSNAASAVADGASHAETGHDGSEPVTSGAHEVQPVQWRDAASAGSPAPAPPVVPFLAPPPAIGGTLITPPIKLGTAITPLAAAVQPVEIRQSGVLPVKAAVPGSSPAAGDTISDINQNR